MTDSYIFAHQTLTGVQLGQAWEMKTYSLSELRALRAVSRCVKAHSLFELAVPVRRRLLRLGIRNRYRKYRRSRAGRKIILKALGLVLILDGARSSRGYGVSDSNLRGLALDNTKTVILNSSLVNARSLLPKRWDLEEYIMAKRIDWCLVTETWIKQDDSQVAIQDITPPGFGILSVCRPKNNRGGGLALIYNKARLDANERLYRTISCEAASFRLTLHDGDHFFVCGIYRPPSGSIIDFMGDFMMLVEDSVSQSHPTMFIGDFNIRMDQLDDPDTIIFLDMMEALGFSNLVDFTTHRRGHMIDLIVCDETTEGMISDIRGGDFLSDHRFIDFRVLLDRRSPPSRKKEIISCHKLKDIPRDKFACFLRSAIEGTDRNELTGVIDLYNKSLREGLDKFAPIKKREVRVGDKCPWMSERIRDMIHLRHKKERKWRSSQSEYDWYAFKQQQSYVRWLIKEAKRSFYSMKFDAVKYDSKSSLYISKQNLVQGEG